MSRLLLENSNKSVQPTSNNINKEVGLDSIEGTSTVAWLTPKGGKDLYKQIKNIS
jgi:hypothetical protein